MLCAPWLRGSSSRRDARAAMIAAVGLVFAVPAVLFQRTLSGRFAVPAPRAAFDRPDSLTGLAGTAALVTGARLTGRCRRWRSPRRRRSCSAPGWCGGSSCVRRIVLRPGQLDAAIVRRLFRLGGTLALTSLVAAGSALVVRSAILDRTAPGRTATRSPGGQTELSRHRGASLWTYGSPKIATKVLGCPWCRRCGTTSCASLSGCSPRHPRAAVRARGVGARHACLPAAARCFAGSSAASWSRCSASR